MDNHTAIAKRRQRLDGIPPSNEAPYDCDVDLQGNRCNSIVCTNQYDDDQPRSGCRVIDYFRVLQEIENLRWMPAMLDYYWRDGLSGDGLKFFLNSGFLTTYE